MPGLWVDGLSNRSDDSQTLEGVILDEILSESSKETNGGRSSVAVQGRKRSREVSGRRRGAGEEESKLDEKELEEIRTDE